MKKLYFVSALFISTFTTFSQDGISIKVDGQTADISGATHTVTAPSYDVFDVLFDVYNNTGSAKQWVITRKRLSVPSGWVDGLCWGHATDPFGGTCYSSTQMNGNPWSTPASQSVLFTINNGEYGKMKPQINPDDFTSGQAHYRYYISDPGSGYSDSVDLIVDFTASIKPVKQEPSVSITPNPASDYISITLANAESAQCKIFDSFGSLVIKEQIYGSKKFNVNDFKPGIYFVTIEISGSKPFSKKLIIK
ncbi:MAG: T9SS type A sorting domain-containing protein [Crocinitomicaceae bacterium]